MSVLHLFACDNCGQESRKSEYIHTLWYELSSEGWTEVRDPDDAVKSRDYCPGCAPTMGGTR